MGEGLKTLDPGAYWAFVYGVMGLRKLNEVEPKPGEVLSAMEEAVARMQQCGRAAETEDLVAELVRISRLDSARLMAWLCLLETHMGKSA